MSNNYCKSSFKSHNIFFCRLTFAPNNELVFPLCYFPMCNIYCNSLSLLYPEISCTIQSSICFSFNLVAVLWRNIFTCFLSPRFLLLESLASFREQMVSRYWYIPLLDFWIFISFFLGTLHSYFVQVTRPDIHPSSYPSIRQSIVIFSVTMSCHFTPPLNWTSCFVFKVTAICFGCISPSFFNDFNFCSYISSYTPSTEQQ